MDDAKMYRYIEAEARKHACELVLPEFGGYIAWSIPGYKGITDEVSELHRVGEPIQHIAHTTCGKAIPDSLVWLSLGPGMMRGLHRCAWCESRYARAIEEEAA